MVRLPTVFYGMLMLLVTAASVQAGVFHTTLDHGLSILIARAERGMALSYFGGRCKCWSKA